MAMGVMGRLKSAWVWLMRWNHCKGFGIQSPTDYRFVCSVVNEHWPYYQYDEIGLGDDRLTRKLGQLYFRLANWRQPSVTIDRVQAAEYILGGCRKTRIVTEATHVELAFVPATCDYRALFDHVDDRSVIVFQDIAKAKSQWRQIVVDERATIVFDLYYCGIVMFDSKRVKQYYKVNF